MRVQKSQNQTQGCGAGPSRSGIQICIWCMAIQTEQGRWNSMFGRKWLCAHRYLWGGNTRKFSVLPKGRYCQYVTVPVHCWSFEVYCMLCIPTSPLFAYYSDAFEDIALQSGYLIRKFATAKFTNMSFVCSSLFCWVRSKLLWPSESRALTDGGRVCAYEELLVPLPYKVRENILNRGSSCINSDWAGHLLSGILVLQ